MSSSSTTVYEPNSPATPTTIDADDSIVLSDLVRSGEASRLRRRGAIRLDHASLAAAAAAAASSAPHAAHPRHRSSSSLGSHMDLIYEGETARLLPRAREPSTDDDDDDDDDASGVGSEEIAAAAALAHEPVTYTLYCGGEPAAADLDADPEPWEPSPLPWDADPLSPRAMHAPRARSNGCGAVVHVSAVPRPASASWAACAPALSHVVPLDAAYFEPWTAVRILRSSCGCEREGVGCAICGNPLGTRYKPCPITASSVSTSSLHDCPPAAAEYIYTFLSGAVTPCTPYAFSPPRTPTIAELDGARAAALRAEPPRLRAPLPVLQALSPPVLSPARLAHTLPLRRHTRAYADFYANALDNDVSNAYSDSDSDSEPESLDDNWGRTRAAHTVQPGRPPVSDDIAPWEPSPDPHTGPESQPSSGAFSPGFRPAYSAAPRPPSGADTVRFSRTVAPHLDGFALTSAHGVRYRHARFPTAFHLLEALQFAVPGGGAATEGLMERVARCASVQDVRTFVARAPRELIREDWHRVLLIKVDEVLYLKMKQHDQLAELLLSTGDALLVYAEPDDPFWGATELGGQNQLGKSLMRVRDALRDAMEMESD